MHKYFFLSFGSIVTINLHYYLINVKCYIIVITMCFLKLRLEIFCCEILENTSWWHWVMPWCHHRFPLKFESDICPLSSSMCVIVVGSRAKDCAEISLMRWCLSEIFRYIRISHFLMFSCSSFITSSLIKQEVYRSKSSICQYTL